MIDLQDVAVFDIYIATHTRGDGPLSAAAVAAGDNATGIASPAGPHTRPLSISNLSRFVDYCNIFVYMTSPNSPQHIRTEKCSS